MNSGPLWLAISFLWSASSNAPMPDSLGQAGPGEKPRHEAYLFAHMLPITRKQYDALVAAFGEKRAD